MFSSIRQLSDWLGKNEKLTLVSPTIQLTRWHILLQSIASRDFNPAHCVPKFAPYSFFGGMVSHGIGVVARAEGAFLQLVRFVEPVEVIALGIENLAYRSPLRCGDAYYYEFSLSRLRRRKERWDCDCHIVCKAISPNCNERLVAEWDWKPSFIEPKPEVPLEKVALLQIRSYRENIVRNALFPVIAFAARKAGVASVATVLCFGALLVGSQGAGDLARRSLQMRQELCNVRQPCSIGLDAVP